MKTWNVMTARGVVKIGAMPGWRRPLYFGFRAEWKDAALEDFVRSPAWRKK